MAQADPTWFAELLTVDDTKAISREAQQRRNTMACSGTTPATRAQLGKPRRRCLPISIAGMARSDPAGRAQAAAGISQAYSPARPDTGRHFNADGTVTLTNLEPPWQHVQRQIRRKRMENRNDQETVGVDDLRREGDAALSPGSFKHIRAHYRARRQSAASHSVLLRPWRAANRLAQSHTAAGDNKPCVTRRCRRASTIWRCPTHTARSKHVFAHRCAERIWDGKDWSAARGRSAGRDPRSL
jgi:hypothetical protein